MLSYSYLGEVRQFNRTFMANLNYIVLDEVQLVEEFVEVILSLTRVLTVGLLDFLTDKDLLEQG